ncbi:DUF4132 domain-containing protein [Dactylosporangium sp. NPDC049742]|uniref:DUF4132 domain-containing protein n=1 Tax=Dactylosporangium sp. NPDC049742 TaxID=3154737 RepID=UPI00341C212C
MLDDALPAVLGHVETPPEIAAAPASSPLGLAVAVAVLARRLDRFPESEFDALVDTWVAAHGVRHVARAVAELAGLYAGAGRTGATAFVTWSTPTGPRQAFLRDAWARFALRLRPHLPEPLTTTSATMVSGAAGSSAVAPGAAVAEAEVSGAALSATVVSDAAGSGVAASAAVVSGVAGSGVAVSAAVVSGVAGSGVAVSAAVVSGVAGSGVAGSSDVGPGAAVAAAVVEDLAALRSDPRPLRRLTASLLAPAVTAWVDEDCATFAAAGDETMCRLLLPSVRSLDQLDVLLRVVAPHWLFWDEPTISGLAAAIGPAIEPHLTHWLRTEPLTADAVAWTAGILATFPTDSAFDALVSRSAERRVRPALAKAIHRFPDLALRRLAEATATPTIGVLLAAHVRADPARAARLLPALSPPAAARVGAMLRVESAPPAAVPPILATPPWTTTAPAAPIVPGLVCPDPPAVPGGGPWAAASADALLDRAGPDVAGWMAGWFARSTQTRPVAEQWLRRHPAEAASALIPPALARPGTARRDASAALRFLVRSGHTATVLAAADRYGPAALAGVQALLTTDPLHLLPARIPTTPAWADALLLPALRVRSTQPPAPPHPADAALPVDSARPADAALPADAVLPAGPAWPADSVLPASSARPVGAVLPAVAVPPASSARSVGAVLPASSARPVDAVLPAVAVLPASSARSVDAVLPADPARPDSSVPPVGPAPPVGAVLPADATRHFVTMLAMSTLDDPYAGVAVVRQVCDPGSLAEFGWSLYQAWRAAGGPASQRWAFTALGLIGDDSTAARLAPLALAWPAAGELANARVAVDILATLSTAAVAPSTPDLNSPTPGLPAADPPSLAGPPPGVGSLGALRQLVRIAGSARGKLKEHAVRRAAEAAATVGLGAEELADRLVPDLDLPADGALILDYGPRRFSVRLDEQLRPYVLEDPAHHRGDPSRVEPRRRELPKPGAKDDPVLAQEAYARFAELRREARTIAAEQTRRLEVAMVDQRRWSAAGFRDSIVAHPVLRELARRLVWATFAGDGPGGAFLAAFRVAEDLTFADVGDEPFALAADAVVGIVHPVTLGEGLGAWVRLFADYEIVQPFVQLGRAVHQPAAATSAGSAVRPGEDLAARLGVDGRTTDARRLYVLDRRGWVRAQAGDGGRIRSMTRRVPGGWLVVVDLEPGVFVGRSDGSGEQTVTVRVEHDHPGGRRPQDGGVAPAGTAAGVACAACVAPVGLDAVTYSEIARDLQDLVT